MNIHTHVHTHRNLYKNIGIFLKDAFIHSVANGMAIGEDATPNSSRKKILGEHAPRRPLVWVVHLCFVPPQAGYGPVNNATC